MVNSGHVDLPPEFLHRLARIVSAAGYEQCLRGFAADPMASFRVNTLTASVEEVVRELSGCGVCCQPVSWCRQAFVAPAGQRQQLVQTAAATDGRLYIQNLSSLLPVLLLDPQPGETILDLAAAPGGKTLHLVAQMQNQGRVSAVEAVRSRYYRLRENLRRGQARIVRTYLTDGRTVGRKTPERFDRVLLDAPCSSEGRFRSGHPDTWRYWSLRKIREQARKQQGLLRSAMRALRPGGTLVYCTCAFAPEENELIIDRQLRRDPGEFHVQEVQLPIPHVEPALTEWRGRQLDVDLRMARRILPQDAMDGFFLCKLRKRSRH